MKIRSTTQIAIVIGSLLAVKDCFALTATNTFQVTATVTDVCTVSATDLAFGTYASEGAAVDSTNTISVTCNVGTGYTIALDSGIHPLGDFNPRNMDNGGGVSLAYNIFTTAGRTVVWGDGSGATKLQPAVGTYTGTGVAQTYTGYGRIPASQNVPGGVYTDRVTVTVTYS